MIFYAFAFSFAFHRQPCVHYQIIEWIDFIVCPSVWQEKEQRKYEEKKKQKLPYTQVPQQFIVYMAFLLLLLLLTF